MQKDKKEIILVFDCLRDPRDIAQVIHLSLATNTKSILTGNSLLLDNFKTINILKSWITNVDIKQVEQFVTFESDYNKCISSLKKKGFTLVGTTPNNAKNLYSSKFSKGKHAMVFGTESSGLSEQKKVVLDTMIKVPMLNGTNFFTISAIAPAITLEIMRQKKLI